MPDTGRNVFAATLAYSAFACCRLLPLSAASAVAGLLGRSLGPHLKVTNRARRHLRLIFPQLDSREIEAVVVDMCDNLFRVAAEYAHISTFANAGAHRIETAGEDKLRAALQSGRPVIFFSAHFGNWELTPLPVARAGGHLHLIYRPPNNPAVDKLIRWVRRDLSADLVPKSQSGARRMVQIMRAGGHIGILVDQKLNEGIAVPFLGRPAMTGTAPAELALKYDAIVMPVRIDRLRGSRFRVVFHDPLAPQKSGDRVADVRHLTTAMNDVISDWIRARPGQWLWLHRRWMEC